MKFKRKKFMKKAATVVIGASLVSSSLSAFNFSLPSKVHAATNSTAESILAKLTPEQRKALKQLSTDDKTGLFLNSKVNLDSSKNVSVIVEFKNKPHKAAVLEAAVQGKSLSETQAKSNEEADHTTFKNDLASTFKNRDAGTYKVIREYKNAFNGVALEVPANKIKDLMNSSAVQAIYSDSTVTVEPPLKEAQPSTEAQGQGMSEELSYLNINKLHQEGYTGKGVKVAVLDTGVDYNHPDIKTAYKGGYNFVDNNNDPMETTYADWVKAGKPGGDPSTYVTEHGTHVSGTIVGQGKNDSPYATTGIAPDADLYVYKVLGPGGVGSTENIIAGIDKAVADGMNVMNLSLGATYNDPLFPDSIAIDNAVLSGVTAVVAAGNAGNGMYTVGSPGAAALALTVGASDVPEQIPTMKGHLDSVNSDMHLLAKGFSDNISSLLGNTYQIVNIGGYGQSWDYNTDVTGKVVLVSRGISTINDKILQAKLKGAAAILIYDNNTTEGYMPFYLGEGTDFIPSFNLTNADGLALQQKIAAGNSQFSFSDLGQLTTTGDNLADFSSRGPARTTYDIKPEITAPGVSVLSTVPGFIHSPDNPTDYKYAYERMSGTSMATPNVTGIVALLLQAHPGLQPEDVKSILMNTADPLNKTYSVFEEGAGRVDPYKAIHSDMEIKVKEKTPTIINGREKQIKEDTGALSFGSFVQKNGSIQDSREITLTNSGNEEKTFDVNVNFQTGARGSLDPVPNGVKLDVPTTIKLNPFSQKGIQASISIPQTAKLGTYEGYITFTNHNNPQETYRVPFGARYTNEGFDYLNLPIPSDSTDFNSRWTGGSWMETDFQVKGFMKTIDAVLVDAKTNQDLGLIGTYDGTLFNENQMVTNYYGFSGYYYPFSGDPNNPISLNPQVVQTGQYKIKLVGTADDGKQFTTEQTFVVDNTTPTLKTSLDSANPFIEYKDGQTTVPFTASVHDDLTAMQKAGLKIDQSNNSLEYYYNDGWYPQDVPVDKNGNYSDQIALIPDQQVLHVNFAGLDAARNSSGQKDYYFVKQGTPYVYGTFDNSNPKMGDTVKLTLTANNLVKLKSANFGFDTDSSMMDVVDVKADPSLQKYGSVDVSQTTTTNYGTSLHTSIQVTYNGTQEISGNVPMVDVTLKLKATTFYDVFPFMPGFGGFPPASFTDANGTTNNNLPFVIPNLVVQPTWSEVKGGISAPAFMDANGNPDYNIDWTKVGATVKITDYSGKVYDGTSSIDRWGVYNIPNLPVTDKPFTITATVPGHFANSFTFYNYRKPGNTLLGQYNFGLPIEVGSAGDVNGDNVIDIMDAVYIKDHWGTNDRNADINHDGVVDAKDMQYVIDNYLKTNPNIQTDIKPKTKYKGQTLDNILHEVGMK